MGEEKKNTPGVGAPGMQTVLDGFEPRTLDHIHSTTETLLISSLLNQGQRYAIKMPELMRITGLDSRTIRMRIHAERQNKVPIMSSSTHGYWLASCQAEIDSFTRSMQGRAVDILETARIISGVSIDEL